MQYIKWRDIPLEERKRLTNFFVAYDDDGEMLVAFPHTDKPIGTVVSVWTDPETGEELATVVTRPVGYP